MFQRKQTLPDGAMALISRTRLLDTRPHPANTLGAKTFVTKPNNPAGPQRRLIVTRSKTGA